MNALLDSRWFGVACVCIFAACMCAVLLLPGGDA